MLRKQVQRKPTLYRLVTSAPHTNAKKPRQCQALPSHCTKQPRRHGAARNDCRASAALVRAHDPRSLFRDWAMPVCGERKLAL